MCKHRQNILIYLFVNYWGIAYIKTEFELQNRVKEIGLLEKNYIYLLN